jgi:hypothetical protein
MPDTKNKKTGANTGKKTSPKGLTAKQIVNRHIKDENDIITEDDMTNVKIDSSVPKDKAHRPLPISADTERPKDEDKDNNSTTPWDVIK